jgi:two-component system chemotaxis response regulator CheY
MKTLIVEDELTSRLLLQGILSAKGECHTAVSGEEAVEAFRISLISREPYDLICMDIKMPGIDGVEALRQIREIEEKHGVPSTEGVKVLMATADESPSGIFQSFNALCDAYFVKPINADKLIQKLRKMQLPV